MCAEEIRQVPGILHIVKRLTAAQSCCVKLELPRCCCRKGLFDNGTPHSNSYKRPRDEIELVSLRIARHVDGIIQMGKPKSRRCPQLAQTPSGVQHPFGTSLHGVALLLGLQLSLHCQRRLRVTQPDNRYICTLSFAKALPQGRDFMGTYLSCQQFELRLELSVLRTRANKRQQID